MDKETNNTEPADKKSYAGIPEAEFVVSPNTFIHNLLPAKNLKIFKFLNLILPYDFSLHRKMWMHLCKDLKIMEM